MTIPILVFAAVLALMLGGYWLGVVLPEQREQQALRARLREKKGKVLAEAGLIKSPEKRSAVAPLDQALGRWGDSLEPLRLLIVRSGLKVTVGTIVLASVFFGVAASAIVLTTTHSLVFAAIGGAAAAGLPVGFVRHAAARRLRRFEEQFPEAIELLGRALRAGHALTTGLQMVGDEVDDPVGLEFRTLFEQQNYGMSLPDALRAFATRMPIVDARFFVTALLTQRESGGNLAEVLDNLASVIRERFKVKRQVRVMSAHGRITGWVLGCLPPAVAGILFVISPDHIRLLVEDPLGTQMVFIAIGLQVTGVLVIRHIVNVEY